MNLLWDDFKSVVVETKNATNQLTPKANFGQPVANQLAKRIVQKDRSLFRAAWWYVDPLLKVINFESSMS